MVKTESTNQEVKSMNTDIDGVVVHRTLGDEIGIYFTFGPREWLAFPFCSAKKAIFSAKRIAQLLQVQYNISTEVEILAINERKKPTEVSSIKMDVGGPTMAKKAGNIRKVAKEMLEAGKTQTEVLSSLIESYKGLGKDDTYADNRARVVLVSVLKKMNLEVADGIKKTRKKAEKKDESQETTSVENTATETVLEPAPSETSMEEEPTKEDSVMENTVPDCEGTEATEEAVEVVE